MNLQLSRRQFLGSSLGLCATLGGLASASAAPAKPAPNTVLVFIFLRGALDGLSAVVPYAEPRYYELRKSIALDKPRQSKNSVLNLDGHFGLHPSLESLMPLFKNKELAIVHATGSPAPTRSHFEAQDLMESGMVKVSSHEGWLARTSSGNPKLSSITFEERLPRSLLGAPEALVLRSLDEFQLRGQNDVARAVHSGLESMYADDSELVKRAGVEALRGIQTLADARDAAKQRAEEKQLAAKYPYPRDGVSGLPDVARVLRFGVETRIATLSMGGWDTHAKQGAATGTLANRLKGLGDSLAAFRRHLDKLWDRTLVLVVSEFGRTAAENGTQGTDHGHGNVMFLLGGNLRGGQVYGKWPGLEAANLYQKRDLAVTTDYRDVFAEVVDQHLGVKLSKPLFPGYKLTPDRRLGLFH